MSGAIYEEQFLLRSKDVDLHRRLRTSRLFELLQEASIRHTEELGMGRDKTLDKGILWIVGMQRIEVQRVPEYDERIVLRSWPGETMHVFFPRYYSMETAEGEALLKGSAMWMLVDQKTRRFVFPESCGVVIEGVITGEETALPSPIRSVPCPSEREFTVPYSYVDLNGHMNNTRYFDLAEDTVPSAREGRRLRALSTEYKNEACCGDLLRVQWGWQGDSCFLRGETDRPCFHMRIDYQPE